MMQRVYPHVIEDPTYLIIHAVIDRNVPIGRHKLLWHIEYPLGKIDLQESDSPNFSVVLSTVKNVLPGASEEYGDKIVSQFVFTAFNALLLGRKNIAGMLAYPILQIEHNRAVLLSTRITHKKFTKAFQDITASILQQYKDGGAKAEKAHIHIDTDIRSAANKNLWESNKKRTAYSSPQYSKRTQERFLQKCPGINDEHTHGFWN